MSPAEVGACPFLGMYCSLILNLGVCLIWNDGVVEKWNDVLSEKMLHRVRILGFLTMSYGNSDTFNYFTIGFMFAEVRIFWLLVGL